MQAHRMEGKKIPIHLLSFLIHVFDKMTAKLVEKTKSDPECRISGDGIWMDVMYVRSSLGLLFGEMVTNLLIIPGDCCIGGVRHILSSFSVLGVISSPTRIRSRLPSSTPFPNHRPHGNLHGSTFMFILFCPERHSQHNGAEGNRLAKTCSLVRVPCDLVTDKHTLHQPFCVQPRVIMTHLHCCKLAQVLALMERDEGERKGRHQHPEQNF